MGASHFCIIGLSTAILIGETVESLFKKPEEIIAKKSEIPHADASKKADVAKVETVTKNETVSPEAAKEGDSAKKDFLQQPFMMLQQQQAAFQTMSQFGADQGNQNAAFAQSAPAMASAPALPAAPSMVAAPAVMSQPAAAMAPSSLPGIDLYHLLHSLAHYIAILSIKETILNILYGFLS